MSTQVNTRGRIIRVRHGAGNPFTKVANEVIRDRDLTPGAFTLLVHLLSKPDDWTVRKAELVNARNWGRHVVQSASRLLKELGYLAVRKHRGANGRWEYEWIVFETRTLRDQMDRRGTLFQEPKAGSEPAPVESDRSRISASGETPESALALAPLQSRFSVHGPTVHGSTVNGQSAPSKTNGVTTEQQQQQPAADAAAAAELHKALTAAGIGEPTRSRLAALDALTPAAVMTEAARCREQGKRTGALVRNLEALAAQAQARGERADKAAARADRAAEQRRQDDREAEADRQRIDAALAALSPHELAEHAEAVKRESPYLRSADPHRNSLLRAAIADRLESDRPDLQADRR